MAVVSTDVITKFAFQGSIDPLTRYNKELGHSIKLLAATTAAIAAGAAAMVGWVTSISKSNDAAIQLSRTTGVSIESLKEWGYAASVSGSSMEAVEASVSSLSQKIGDASVQGNEDFARLGISVYKSNGQLKTATEIMDDFARRTRAMNLTVQQRQSFAERLGIDRSLVQLLGKSGDEIDSLRKKAIELGRMTTKDADAMAAYNDSITTIDNSYENLKVKIAVGLLPQVQQLADSFSSWASESSADIVTALKDVVEFVGQLVDSLKRMLPVIALITGAFLAWKVATIGLSGVLGIVFSPLVIGTAVVTGLYLIVDDLITAFRGGKSVIADFFKDTFDVDIVKELTSAFQFLMKNAINPLIEGLKQVWSFLSYIGKSMINVGSSISGFIGGLFGSDSAPVQPRLTPQGSTTNNSRNVSISQGVEINISTDDPVRAGQEVNSALNSQLNDAYYQYGGDK